MMSDTVDQVFAQAAQDAGSSAHLVFAAGDSCTYRETYQRAQRLAAVLIAGGIAPGDRVVCFLGNSRPLFELYIACGLTGATAVPINTLSTAREVGNVIADCTPRGIVVQRSALAALSGEDLAQDLPVRLLFKPESEAPTCGWRDYEEALASTESVTEESCSRPDDAAMIMYSSGTTGAPKGIVLGHRQLLANARLVRQVLGYGPSDRFLTLLPSFHVFGYSFDFLQSALARAPMVVLPTFEPQIALDLIQQKRVTVLAGVPLMFVTMFDPAAIGDRDISCLRLIDVGGGPVPPSLVRGLQRNLGVNTVESYGLTEISPVASVQIPGRLAPEGSCGPVLPGIELRVHDRDGNPVATSESGELQFRCNTFMIGYWQQPELTAATLAEGWLRTGDVGRVDEAGNIFIHDRIKDMIVTNGYNVYPKEVELVLYAHPAVQSVAIVGVPHEVRGEDLHAFVVRAPGADTDGEALITYCREQLARFKVPRGVSFIDAMPLTASG